ncbi:DUF3987 domain-containing protein [Chlorogloea sp. CCALA 695]|uniref:DUF3987 domain-containing protein n=1 Tax=Chlorogloea sp. CCALA 695 TaxID=2107693 RepID=UPI000D048B9F|nr:DUF3987 domain-containing protein [Chlorogloea sp. CCALA 695]PSB28837.1 DNA primase [Chlorogloea sp. CCALA 695]
MNYQFPQTDRALAQKQLAYLGYTSNQVFLRFFYHSDNPKKGDDKGRKLNVLDWGAIASHQQDERGTYVVVNGAGGGHEDKDIKQCAAIFCEWDDRPVEDQLLHWETLGFFEPTFTVYSGDKSAQPYWVFDTPINVEQWRDLQRLLIEVMGADPSNKNPSRVFRLAGGWHIKPGREPRRTEIVQASGQKYTCVQLKERLKALAKPAIAQKQNNIALPPLLEPSLLTYQRYEDISLPVPQTVPIEVCLAKESRSLLQSGCAQGGRNFGGAKLARDLIGTASYLQTIGQSLDGDPRTLLDNYAKRCTPPLPNSEIESIWASAAKSNPAPSCTPDGVENCLRAWYWKNYVQNNTPHNNKQCFGFSPSGNQPSISSRTNLCDRIKRILTSYETESTQTAALMDLAADVKKSFNEIKNLARIIQNEGEQATEVVAAIESFTPIIKNCRKRLDIRKYLNPILAEPLIAKAAAMPTAPEYLFNTLLPSCASRIGTSARIVIDPVSGYTQDCIFWTANVNHSGQAKTPPQKEVISPLEKMEGEAKDIYDTLLSDYEQDKKSEGKPPVRMRRLLSNVTSSTKIRIHQENPRGLLEYIDELVADYQRLNQYKGGGKGDDLQLELSFFNGTAINYDRHDARLFLSRTAFSKTGTYQWDTLARLMGDDVNFISSGYSARFLYCSILDAPPRYLDLLTPKANSNFTETLEYLYEQLEGLPQQDYLLTREAKVLFQAWNHTLADDEREENYFGFSIVYAKIEAYAARIALWLHIVNAVCGGKLPEPTIDGETMRHAIEISSFYLWQQKLIHGNNAPTRKLEGIFFKVQTQAEKYFAKSKQGLNASFLKTRINALKGWAVEKIRTVVFKTLAAAGHGRIEGEGSEMKYFPLSQLLVDVGAELVAPPIAETYLIDGMQPAVGEVGDLTTPVCFSPVITLENHSQEAPPPRQLLPEQPIHQFTNNNAETTSVTGIEAVGDTTNSPPIAPTPNLALLLLQSTTWIEIANSLQKDSQKLIDVMNSFDKAQRKKIASVLIEFLCSEPQNISELTWIPIKMLNWVFKRLTFTVSRIGGDFIDDARLEQVENLSFVSVEGLGSNKELWVFCEASSGKNIPVYGADGICGISVRN